MEQALRAYFKDIDTRVEGVDEFEEAPTALEIDTLREFLSGDMMAEEAARRLACKPAQSKTAFAKKVRMSRLWSVINDAAVDLPFTQPLLVDLLKAIRASEPVGPATHGSAGPGPEPDGGDWSWSKLGGSWGHKWADSLGLYESGFIFAEKPEDLAEAATLWPRAAAFSARLAATQDPVLRGDPVRIRGVPPQRGGLVRRGDPTPGKLCFVARCAHSIVRALDMDKALRDERYRCDIPAAAQLFALCPQELWDHCRAGGYVEDMPDGDCEGANCFWTGELEKLSVERWDHWKKRWLALKETEVPGTDMKELASAALEGMESAV
ncbi:hypothetical protein F4778DRAFT_283389 [Xylariomycetidae sp. FL2044]|nr:hypothetical protein F4778DRAFT_283389 [Xylariomycetidae sp. FL2044]